MHSLILLLCLSGVASTLPWAKRQRVHEETEAAEILIQFSESMILEIQPSASKVPEPPVSYPDTLRYSEDMMSIHDVPGNPDKRLVAFLDGPGEGLMHRGHNEFELSNKAAAFGLANKFLAHGQLELVSADVLKALGLPLRSPSQIQELRAENFATLVTLTERTGDLWAEPLSAIRAGRGRLPFSSAVGIVISVIKALKKLHLEADMMHGLITPDTVMITPEGGILFTDFRRAKSITHPDSMRPRNQVPVQLKDLLFFSDFYWPDNLLEPLPPASVQGDLYGALELVNWLTRPELFEFRGIPSIRQLKFEFQTSRNRMPKRSRLLDPRELLVSTVPGSRKVNPTHYDALVTMLERIRATVL